MSDTPVTDAAAFRSGMGHEYVEADVARGLERDRAALAAKCAQFHRAARMALDELEANRRGIAVTYATPTDDPAREIRRLLYGGRALEATRQPCPYCTSDNEAIRDIYYDQNCRECVKRMTKCRGHANWQVCPDCCPAATRYP